MPGVVEIGRNGNFGCDASGDGEHDKIDKHGVFLVKIKHGEQTSLKCVAGGLTCLLYHKMMKMSIVRADKEIV